MLLETEDASREVGEGLNFSIFTTVLVVACVSVRKKRGGRTARGLLV